MTYDNPWLFNGVPFESENIQDNYGFVYIITDSTNGKRYVGRKYFWSVRKKASGKRGKVKKESDWKSYYGSSKVLQALIEESSESRFKREIISLHKTKGETNYNETKLQFKFDVLEAVDVNGERLFYNDNILSRYFSKSSKKKAEVLQ